MNLHSACCLRREERSVGYWKPSRLHQTALIRQACLTHDRTLQELDSSSARARVLPRAGLARFCSTTRSWAESSTSSCSAWARWQQSFLSLARLSPIRRDLWTSRLDSYVLARSCRAAASCDGALTARPLQSLGWNYVFNDAISMASDLTASELLIAYWTPNYNWVPALVFWFVLVGLNLFHVGAYGEVSPCHPRQSRSIPPTDPHPCSSSTGSRSSRCFRS